MKFTQNKIYLLIVVFVIFLLLFLNFFAFINSKIVCGKIIGQIKLRDYQIEFVFEKDGEDIVGNMTNSKFKNLTLDSLKKIDCVKIEYSTLLPSINRVIDKRVLK